MLFTALRHPDLLSVPGSHLKYRLSADDECALDELNTRLITLDRQPFLDPDFSLAELAAVLAAPSRQVSQLVNARHAMNVATYINRQRVQRAAQLLASSDKPIKAILFESGFRSKSIFNREMAFDFRASQPSGATLARPTLT
jgi:AraC-like DNA-binding protein